MTATCWKAEDVWDLVPAILSVFSKSEQSTKAQQPCPEGLRPLASVVEPIFEVKGHSELRTELERRSPAILREMRKYIASLDVAIEVSSIPDAAEIASPLLGSAEGRRLAHVWNLSKSVAIAELRLLSDLRAGGVPHLVLSAFTVTPQDVYSDEPIPLRLIQSAITRSVGNSALGCLSVVIATRSTIPPWLIKGLVDQIEKGTHEQIWFLTTLGYGGNMRSSVPPGDLEEMYCRARELTLAFDEQAKVEIAS